MRFRCGQQSMGRRRAWGVAAAVGVTVGVIGVPAVAQYTDGGGIVLDFSGSAFGQGCPTSQVFELTPTITGATGFIEFTFEVVGQSGSGGSVTKDWDEYGPPFTTPTYVTIPNLNVSAAGADPELKVTAKINNGDSVDVTSFPVTLRSTPLTFLGTGTRTDPYLISTPAELQDIPCVPDGSHFALSSDLDFSGVTGMAPIGFGSSPFDPLDISLDGRGHTISGMTIDMPAAEYVGLFSLLNGSDVRNLAIDGATIRGQNYVGTLVGQSERRNSFDHVTVTNSSVTGMGRIGLLAGRSGSDVWSQVAASGSITVDADPADPSSNIVAIGGLVGEADQLYLRDGVVDVAITGSSDGRMFHVGGVLGTHSSDPAFLSDIDSTSTINLTAGEFDGVGGVTGREFRDGSVMRSSTITSNIILTATTAATDFHAFKIGGFAGSIGHSVVEDSSFVGSITIDPTPAQTIRAGGSAYVGGFSGDVTNPGRVARSSIDVDVTVLGDASFVGAVIGRTSQLNAADLLVLGSVEVTGSATQVGGLIGEPRASNTTSEVVFLRNVVWRGTRTVGSEVTPSRTVLWGDTDPDSFGAGFARGLLWDSAVNTDQTPEASGSPATPAELATASFMRNAGYDLDHVWCVTDNGPVLRVLEPAACEAGSIPLAPGAPTAAQSGSTVTLDVTPPDATPEATNYEYSTSTDGGATWTAWLPLTASSATPTPPVRRFDITGLALCASYSFKVRAINTVGAGPESTPSNAVTLAIPAPGAPTNLRAAAGTKASVSLTWSAPASTAPAPTAATSSKPGSPTTCAAITRYEYRFSTNNGSSWSNWTSTVSTATRATVGKLSTAKNHVFQVRAVNQSGVGAPSNTSNSVKPRS